MSGCSEREVQNKVHYLVNCEMERVKCEAARQRVADAVPQAMADEVQWISLESDGMVAIPADGRGSIGWELDVLGALGPQFTVKPYLSFQANIALLKGLHPHLPEELFHTYDSDWHDVERIKLECAARIRAGEQPSMIYARCIPGYLVGETVLVKDVYRPSSFLSLTVLLLIKVL